MAVAGQLRPTPDRVRETLFNWLAADVEGARCLALFAGNRRSGSRRPRAARRPWSMVERERKVAAALSSAARTLGAGNVEVVRADALHWRPADGDRFDVVFLDPPYTGPLPEAALARLDRIDALTPRCRVYLETDRDPADFELPPGWRSVQARRAGRVRYHLVSRIRPAGRR